jgi:hypothetical protein
MLKIDLENQFKAYLQRVELEEQTMSLIQLQETKRAFFGGLSQMFVLFLEIGELPEENCNAIFDDIESQISLFWLEETSK